MSTKKKILNEDTICLSWITLKRTTKVRKKTVVETQLLSKETFLHKGISPEVVIRRRGVLDRFRKITGWTTGKIEITNIDIVTTHSQGCPEKLIDISKTNI